MPGSASVSPSTDTHDHHEAGKPRFAGLGLDPEVEAAYESLLEHPDWTTTQIARHLAISAIHARELVQRLSELDLVHVGANGTELRAVAPELGLSALAARLDAELAMRRQQLEQGRMAISDLVAGMGKSAPMRGGQVADVCWGARDVTNRLTALTNAASSEVVAMSTANALAIDTLVPERPIEGVCYRLVFEAPEHNNHAWNRWMASLDDAGAEVRVGAVPTAALIVDGTTVALPILDQTAGQIVGLATLRLPSAVTAVVELFERVWAEATPSGSASAEDDPAGLCTREKELLALLFSGTTDESAASKLGVSVRTVRRMVSDLMTRLGARSRFEAGARAAEKGWLRLPAESH